MSLLDQGNMDPILNDVLEDGFALCLGPGFCYFYAHIGLAEALEEAKLLPKVSHLAGASAGSLVAGLIATGQLPHDIKAKILAIRRREIWDVGGICGLLRGHLFEKRIGKLLLRQRIEGCKIPLAVTSCNILRLCTEVHTYGYLPRAIHASCTFPGLFQPVMIDGAPHIDGACFDQAGILGLPGLPPSKVCVNVVCSRLQSFWSVLPAAHKDGKLITIVLDKFPQIYPWSIESMGPAACETARLLMARALQLPMQEISENHWVVYLNGSMNTKSETPEINKIGPPKPAWTGMLYEYRIILLSSLLSIGYLSWSRMRNIRSI